MRPTLSPLSTLLALLFFLVSAPLALAQDDADAEPDDAPAKAKRSFEDKVVLVGPVLGLNVSDAGGQFGPSTMKLGAVAGAFLDFRIDGMFSLQPEVLFSMKGRRLGERYLSDSSSFAKVNLWYVQIPLLAKIKFMKKAKHHPFVLFGPALGFNIYNNTELTFESSSLGEQTFEGEVADVRPLEFSLVFGAGYELNVADKHALNVMFRYEYGVNNYDENFTQNVLQLMVGYGF